MRQEWWQPFFEHTQLNIFQSFFNIFQLILNFHEFASTCKKSVYSIILFYRYLIQKYCNLIILEYFGPYLRNQNFPKCGICAGSLQTKFFNKFKKPYFCPNFPIFEWKKNPALSRKTSYGFLKPCQDFEKSKDPIPR